VSWRTYDGNLRIVHAAVVYAVGLVVTDIVAGGATSLFAAYHFNRLPTYSLAANVIAVPIMGAWIMPFGLLGLVLMPFGLDRWAFEIMGHGVALVDAIARAIAAWPGAQVHVPPMDVRLLAFAAAGAVFICIWKGGLRWFGVVPVAIALSMPWISAPPDLLLDETARVIAVTDADGHVVPRPSRAGRFVKEVWTDRFGASQVKWLDPSLGLACDAGGCTLARNGQKALIAFSDAALAEDCGAHEIIVTAQVAHDLCRKGKIIDLFDVRDNGGYAVWLTPEGIRTRSVRQSTGKRVWTGGTGEDAAEPLDDAES
jgi:competence protein ComEC